MIVDGWTLIVAPDSQVHTQLVIKYRAKNGMRAMWSHYYFQLVESVNVLALYLVL